MSRSLLAKRLRELERAGVVERRRVPGRESREYFLSPAGEELRPIIEALGVWGQRWVLHELDEADLDPSLLMWDIRRSLRRDELPEQRVVVRFELTDVDGPRRRWWLLADSRGGEICMTDPGFAVDLEVTVSLRALAAYWTGRRSWRELLGGGELRLGGDPWLRRSIERWLGRSSFAEVPRPGATGPVRG